MARTAGPAATGSRHGPVWWATAALTAAAMLPVLYLDLASGLLAPPWAVVLLVVAWLALAWLALMVHRRHGALSLLVPVGGVVLWFAVITVGDALLGWTA